jgi:uncharacterized protein
MSTSNQYTPPLFLFSPHLETIFPALLRRVDLKSYTRERITTPDNDFLDLDWLKQGSHKLVILSHGLEGNSTRPYIKGMAKALFENGYDILAWNFRGCSEEMNKQLRFYHSGATDDLDVVVQHASGKNYKEIFLVGFSLGGNLTLKYLGEPSSSSKIKKAVAISVPLDLETSCRKISESSNWVYSNRFLTSLKKKITTKAGQMKGLDINGIQKIKTLLEFDNRYTAPLHGFENAVDYYRKCSSINFLSDISTPTLIINTLNDPFLSKECFPSELVKNHPSVKLEILLRGGHVGFTQFNKNGLYWSEQRALDFFTS